MNYKNTLEKKGIKVSFKDNTEFTERLCHSILKLTTKYKNVKIKEIGDYQTLRANLIKEFNTKQEEIKLKRENIKFLKTMRIKKIDEQEKELNEGYREYIKEYKIKNHVTAKYIPVFNQIAFNPSCFFYTFNPNKMAADMFAYALTYQFKLNENEEIIEIFNKVKNDDDANIYEFIAYMFVAKVIFNKIDPLIDKVMQVIDNKVLGEC